MAPYLVYKERDLDVLASRVSEAIIRGYRPCGGLVFLGDCLCAQSLVYNRSHTTPQEAIDILDGIARQWDNATLPDGIVDVAEFSGWVRKASDYMARVRKERLSCD